MKKQEKLVGYIACITIIRELLIIHQYACIQVMMYNPLLTAREIAYGCIAICRIIIL